MKYINKGGEKYLLAENSFEQAALDWARNNPPTKIGNGMARVEAFIAGAEWATIRAETT